MALTEAMGYVPAATQNLLLISLCSGVHRGQHPPPLLTYRYKFLIQSTSREITVRGNKAVQGYCGDRDALAHTNNFTYRKCSLHARL